MAVGSEEVEQRFARRVLVTLVVHAIERARRGVGRMGIEVVQEEQEWFLRVFARVLQTPRRDQVSELALFDAYKMVLVKLNALLMELVNELEILH